MEEARLRHLEAILAVVTRLAGNSATIKTWTVTLTAALFALAADKANPQFVWAALVPTVSFWYLDSYFLRQERLFRCLYDKVRSPESEVDLFDMNVAPFDGSVESQLAVACSRTLLGFYAPLVLVVSSTAFFLMFR